MEDGPVPARSPGRIRRLAVFQKLFLVKIRFRRAVRVNRRVGVVMTSGKLLIKFFIVLTTLLVVILRPGGTSFMELKRLITLRSARLFVNLNSLLSPSVHVFSSYRLNLRFGVVCRLVTV